ncbi:universal stress protein [Bacteroidota bacterium]
MGNGDHLNLIANIIIERYSIFTLKIISIQNPSNIKLLLAMKTVLFLTNFSKASTNAISGFLRLYSQYIDEEYKFILLNAYGQPHAASGILMNMEEMLESFSNADLEEEQKQYLKILEGKNAQFELMSYDGDIIEAIDFACKKNIIDLVLMGSKGSNILRELLISNNTSRIINLSTIPVMIIPENAVLTIPVKLVFASDMMTNVKKEEFKKMLERLSVIKAEVLILNVYKHEKPDTEDFENYMEDNLKTIKHSFHYVQDSDIAHGISSFVKNVDSDFLALVGREGSFLSKLFHHSMSYKFAFKADQPVIILNEAKE